MTIKKLKLKDKVYISFAISSVLPLLILFYILINLGLPEIEQAARERVLINVDLLVVLVVVLSVLGLAVNLQIIKGVRVLMEKTRAISPGIELEQDREIDEISQLSENLSSIIGKMNEQVSLLSRLEGDLSAAKEELKVSHGKLKSLAVIDELTGLFNRRYFNTRLEEELQRAKRYNHPIALMLIDIDDFKSVNDNFGHTVGDLVLKELSSLLEGNTRKVDIVFRYGGEEFAVILPETESPFAIATARRVSRGVEENVFLEGNDDIHVRLTVSIGICVYRRVPADGMDIVRNADTALYRAKRLGKNSVVEYSEGDEHSQA